MESKNESEKPQGELPKQELPEREKLSFVAARDPSLDRRCRPRPETQKVLFADYQKKYEEESFCECTDTDGEDAFSLAEEEVPCTSSGAERASVEMGPQVYLRLRPVKERSTAYAISEDGNVLIAMNNANRLEKHFGFTSIFESSVGQRDIYDICVGPRICEEECVTIMAYGTSGSGKTYTLLGNDVDAGIIPRALDNIFTICQNSLHSSPKMKLINGCIVFLQDEASLKEMQIRKKLLDLCPDIAQGRHEESDEADAISIRAKESVLIWISFVEIYNEFVHDLLEIPPKPTKVVKEMPRKNLRIVCNKGQVFVQGLTSVFVQSSEEALRLLRLGQQRCTFASTSVNATSSRSHCIFTVDILKYSRSGITTQSSYKFCDLAGSERVNSAGTTGQRLKEAKNINTSLMVLGRCLDAASMATKKKIPDVIPYRNSKLTMLLQAALLGKEKLSMIVTVAPVDRYYEENLNVLNFASIAKNIVFKMPVTKRHRSSYAGLMEFHKMAADSKGSAYAKELENKNVDLQLDLESLQQAFMEQNEQLEVIKRVNEVKDQQLRLLSQNLVEQKWRYETEIIYLKNLIARQNSSLDSTQETQESESVIEVVDDDE